MSTIVVIPKLNDMQEIPVAPIPQNAGKEATLKQMEQQIHHQNIINESDAKHHNPKPLFSCNMRLNPRIKTIFCSRMGILM
jgi:hypothetical protein